ncbi:MAG: hypothetical protein OJF50_001305 [Nitrospira sp.]|nr:hypothetical protein [Nitrospira sp.]
MRTAPLVPGQPHHEISRISADLNGEAERGDSQDLASREIS